MTDEQMRDLVKECGLDWQRGYMALFDSDPTNRYAVLIEAAAAAARRQALEDAARACEAEHVGEGLVDDKLCREDQAYNNALVDAAAAIRALPHDAQP